MDQQFEDVEALKSDLLAKIQGPLEYLEGDRPDAYVPKQDGKVIGTSGVTIGMGFDLGQIDLNELSLLPISEENKKKLEPFVGLKGKAALDKLEEKGSVELEEPDENNPTAQRKALNQFVKRKELKKAEDNLAKHTGLSLYSLPENVRQALVIQSFQLGNGLYKNDGKDTNFKKQLKALDFEAAGNNMRTWQNEFDKKGNRISGGLYKRYRAIGDLLKGDITIDQVTNTADSYYTEYKGEDAKTHKVESGDSLYKIAQDNNLTLDELRELNNIPAGSDLIKVGDELKLGQLDQPYEIIELFGQPGRMFT